MTFQNKINLHLTLEKWYRNSDVSPIEYKKLTNELKEKGLI